MQISASRHLWAPTHFRFPSDHPVATPLRQMLAMRDLTTLKTTGQQRVAVLVTDIGEVLARHADPRGLGPLQPSNEVPFLFSHRPLLISTQVLVQVDWEWEGEKYGSRLKRRPPRRESRLCSLWLVF